MNWREQMEDELEIKVWRTAQQAYDMAAFVRLIEAAVSSFKREPGFDPSNGCTRHGLALRTSGCCVMF